MEVKKDILWRVYLSYIVMVIVCLVIFGKAVYIQQVQGDQWRSMGNELHQKIQETEADRGTIYSEDGEMLSTSIPQFNIYIDFAADGLREKSGQRFRDNLDSLSDGLATLFNDKSKAEYKRLLQQGFKNKDRYFPLQKNISYRDYQTLKNFPLVRLGKNKSGFIVDEQTIRLNPYKSLAYRTIGLDRENAQKIGLEQTYDTLLKGTTGRRLVRYIAGGVSIPVDDAQIEPENGKDIVTTLDVFVQEVAENALMKAMRTTGSQYGTCIVMETKTGKIKAIANLGQHADSAYLEDYNYAMRTTEPGSTIKLATLLSVLSEGKTTINNLVEVGSAGHAFVGVREVNDAEPAPKPVMTVKECFAHSSNVGMSKIAFNTFATQPTKFLKYLHTFRMDTMTGIDLRGEEKPKLPKMERGNGGLMDMVTMSFGYAIQVSPLQTLTLYNTIANNGKMMRPYLVNSVKSDGEIVKQFLPTVLNEQICKPEVIKAAHECLVDVAIEGTAKEIFKNSPYSVAGKTGTAHVADGKYKYEDGVYLASFVGYFPAEQPQYTCIVVIKTKPHALVHFGGAVSGPVFKEIADRLYTTYVKKSIYTAKADKKIDSSAYNYAGAKQDLKQIANNLRMPFNVANYSTNEWLNMSGNNGSVQFVNKQMDTKTMPQLKGLGLKDAVVLCENMGLKVNAKGKGRVAVQSINEGQSFAKGQVVNVELN